VLENPHDPSASVFMRIYNADGQEAGACGNATRCVGSLLSTEYHQPTAIIQTTEGLLQTEVLPDQRIQVNMGRPRFGWQEIPLAHACDTANMPIIQGVLTNPFAVSMGNPHMVFFVPHVEGIDLVQVGSLLTHHPLYTQGANVEVVEVLDRQNLRVRVYERGVGPTLACGTGACASLVAAVHRDLADRSAQIHLEGGILSLSYDQDVIITGAVAHAFDGTFTQALWQDLPDHLSQAQEAA
jgi:diaminopimelate epimerase